MNFFIKRSSCPSCGSIKIGEVLLCKDYTVTDQFFEIWHCENCGLRFTQNVPDQKAIASYYKSETYISHSDTGQGLINKLYKIARNYTLTWKMKLVNRFSIKEPGCLLDIGAGTGAFFKRAAEGGWMVTGLEPDEGARDICKQKYQIQLDLPDTLFHLPAQKFNVVTMWHVLEHVHQLHEYIDQVKRIMKDNAVALVALPNYTSQDAHHYKEYWAAYDVPRHLYHFSPAAIKILFEKHGMKVDSIIPMWLDALYISLLSEEYKKEKSDFIAAASNGLRSNWNAYRRKEECSSLVYIIRKKEHT